MGLNNGQHDVSVRIEPGQCSLAHPPFNNNIIRREVCYHGNFLSATEVLIFSSKKVTNQSLLSKLVESQVFCGKYTSLLGQLSLSSEYTS